jgi:uncharacterized membrane protein YfcA
VTLAWAIGALVMFFASFVLGLAGFGIALVAMAFLPYVMSPVAAIVVLTVYALAFSLVALGPLRRDVTPRALGDLVLGSVAGTPLGVWALATLPVSGLNRLIGLILVLAVALELRGVMPRRLPGRAWALGAGFLSGLVGGAVGTPGPPVVMYATTQGWSPRTQKANVMAFFVVNQAVILIGFWWADLLTSEVLALAAAYALPALAGVLAGMAAFTRIDAVKFRRLVFGLLLLSGLILLVRG